MLRCIQTDFCCGDWQELLFSKSRHLCRSRPFKVAHLVEMLQCLFRMPRNRHLLQRWPTYP